MKPATPRTPTEEPRGGARARHSFALAAVALALASGLGTPALARTLSHTWRMPIEAALIGVGFLVAVGFLAAGWALGRRVDRLSDEARRDPVTKVGNRRHWEECLAHEVERAAKAKMPLSLLVVDVDNLKKLNDAGGHGAGDTALAIVGDVLNDTCRSRDVAARFGGDEFALLLPRTRASEARILAERIRAELSVRRRSHGAPLDKLLTVSIGICDLAMIEEPRPHLLFDAADRALYAAKQAGRDRVEVFARTSMASTVIVLEERRRNRKKNRRTLG
jgi:diguanylate cyclase (GGDEF)-like protein